jgi:hypothetical protein
MFSWILNTLFACRHRRKSRPMTIAQNTPDEESGTFVVCLDCGTRFRYNWQEMRVGKAVR